MEMKRLMMKNLCCLFLFFCFIACSQAEDVVKEKEPSKPEEPSVSTTELRIMSYNVQRCRGMDNAYVDYDRVSDVIKNVKPDVVAVQELDSMSRLNGKMDDLKEMAERTGMYYTHGMAIPLQGGAYGVGILSKKRPVSFRKIIYPLIENLPSVEDRALLICEFDKYVFCCTHFCHISEKNRLAAIDKIIEELGTESRPVFLAGDLNATLGSLEIKKLQEYFKILNDPEAFSFPADNPTACIDFIMGLESVKHHDYTVLKRQVVYAPTQSDHRPIYVDVTF